MTPGEMEILKWALTQGGVVLVLLIVVWSYRRDFTRLMARDDEKIAILTELVGQTRASMEGHRAVIEGLQRAVDELRRAIDRMSERGKL